jgi:hypothetical protein
MAALVSSAPFLVHLDRHRDEATARYAQTAVLDPENQVRLRYLTPPEPLPELFALQAERTLGMYDRYPDGGGFFPTGRPILGVPLAQLALIGAVYLLVRARRDVRLAVLSVWFWLGLSGVLLTVETPHVLRSVGMLPSLCFVLAVPLVDFVDRALAWRPGLRATLSGLATAVLAVILIAPEVASYFTAFRTMPQGWGPMNREGQAVAALGANGPVYSLEMNEHLVNSGWVRLLAPAAQRGRVPNPGRELPVLATTLLPEPGLELRPEVVPSEGQGLAVILSPDPNQGPYVALLQQLYPGGTVDDAADGRRAFRVSSSALAATQGVTLVAPDGSARGVDGFGEMPTDVGLPARLTWRAGVRLTRGGGSTACR